MSGGRRAGKTQGTQMHLTPGHPCGSQGLSQEVFYDAVGAILLACAAFQDLRERGTLVRLAVRNPLFILGVCAPLPELRPLGPWLAPRFAISRRTTRGAVVSLDLPD